MRPPALLLMYIESSGMATHSTPLPGEGLRASREAADRARVRRARARGAHARSGGCPPPPTLRWGPSTSPRLRPCAEVSSLYPSRNDGVRGTCTCMHAQHACTRNMHMQHAHAHVMHMHAHAHAHATNMQHTAMHMTCKCNMHMFHRSMSCAPCLLRCFSIKVRTRVRRTYVSSLPRSSPARRPGH